MTGMEMQMPLRVVRALRGLPPDPADPLLEYEVRFVEAEHERCRQFVWQRAIEIALGWD